MANVYQYREHLYRQRAHPIHPPSDFIDNRDSFTTVYLSAIPFLVAEYFTEVTYEFIPSGLVFPVGYLLFWAFFYTYYRPGFLEERLSQPKKYELVGIPSVLLGVVIWFIKVTVIELMSFILHQLLGLPNRPHRQKTAPRGPQPVVISPALNEHPHHPTSLPPDILRALRVLGLPDNTDWNTIHRRYRDLAKQFHPDLNPDITAIGRRFMTYDEAYQKLSGVKGKYFL